MTKACVFTHHDLDGAVAYLTLKWFLPQVNLEVITVKNVFDFRDIFLKWSLNNQIKDYTRIFVLDLDVSGCEDLTDRSNFFIVDHHETHKKTTYKNARAFVTKYSSASKLLYKILSKKYPDRKITNNQKYLISLADDYDSYTLKSPLSKLLNVLFWNLTNNFFTFCSQFQYGMKGFTKEQASIIKLYYKDFKKYQQGITEIYIGETQVEGEQVSICALIANKYINDLADLFFEKEGCDLIIIYNNVSNKVYVRKNRESKKNIHVGRMCEQWGGGGHEGAGGAPAAEGFVDLSKSLSPKAL